MESFSELWKIGYSLFLCSVISAIPSSAQKFKTLVDFNGTNGFGPYSPLVQVRGSFYGTTFYGGKYTGHCSLGGCGTIFRVTARGRLTTIYEFGDMEDGYAPEAGLLRANDGNLYGTTVYGGGGLGTVFKVSAKGTVTTLHSFGGSEGAHPTASLVQGSDGNLYGTALVGGGGVGFDCGGTGCGTVFRMTQQGLVTTLYSFCHDASCTDGERPYRALLQATDGNFYGTTTGVGSSNCRSGCGTIFKITSAGTLTTLYRFQDFDGAYPDGPLIQGSDGRLYGTTFAGGAGNSKDCGVIGCGTVFRITPKGRLKTLHSFCMKPGCPDGESPWAGLVETSDGNFYGTTYGNAKIVL